jgi:hypothetical protein
MAYRMRMGHDSDEDARRIYVDSLRWRRSDLQGKLEAVGRQIAARTRDETELRQHLRAVEQLLLAEGERKTETSPARDPFQIGSDSPTSTGNAGEPESDHQSLSFARWGPKSRAIYAAAAAAIREAGVPLYYRVLAEEVQKNVALGGVDPGATLIAHLHRAQDVFPRVGRGVYGLQGMVAGNQQDQPKAKASASRRRKTRRRTR